MSIEREVTSVRLATAVDFAAGTPVWQDRSPSAEVCFLGRVPRAASGGGDDGLETVLGRGVRGQARMRQVHGATVLSGAPGECGEGDAMVTSETGLALMVVTADCLPVLVAASDRVAAIHAGWRGLVGGVIEAALAGFDRRDALIAWIGPAIGPCCYEVGPEVADPVVERSSIAVRSPGKRERPHLDLVLAAEIVLARCGVGEIRRLPLCTSCHGELLESYRRDGASARRNRSLIWLRDRASRNGESA
jgi:polyphenol oxidase